MKRPITIKAEINRLEFIEDNVLIGVTEGAYVAGAIDALHWAYAHQKRKRPSLKFESREKKKVRKTWDKQMTSQSHSKEISTL